MNIALFGPTGRTGSEIVQSVVRRQARGEAVRIVAGVVSAASKDLGKSVEGIDAPLVCELRDSSQPIDVVIDFSTAAGSRAAVEYCRTHSIPGVICTTAVGDEQEAQIREAGTRLPMVRATNTSVAVAVLIRLAEVATSLLGDDFDVELFELHHRGKKDAPSGTAITVLEHIAASRGVQLKDVLSMGRSGHDAARAPGQLGAQALRGGDAAGEHTVYFLGEGERIEITQRATNRRVYADGALRAARWICERGRKAGTYSMIDVLNG